MKKNRGYHIQNGTGAILLERRKVKDGSIILCLLPTRHEYATWWQGEGENDATAGGHYFMLLSEALKDYNERT